MIINRSPSPYPRRGGPSCLTLILVFLAGGAAVFLFSNVEQVVDVIIPTVTPEPTRSAESFAFSAALYNRDGDTEKSIDAYDSQQHTLITYFDLQKAFNCIN